jgi:hypothetical protein
MYICIYIYAHNYGTRWKVRMVKKRWVSERWMVEGERERERKERIYL